MNAAQRLQEIDEWVSWLRGELDREVVDLVAAVAGQPFGLSVAASTSAALIGRQHIAERVEPLLQILDQIQEQIRIVGAESIEATP
jgi:hypothetical protein